MKKNYVTPRVSKTEVDIEILRMFTSEGFMELFWERLREARRTDAGRSHESVFDEMNEKWYGVMGSFRYSSYDSFRQLLKRANVKKE